VSQGGDVGSGGDDIKFKINLKDNVNIDNRQKYN
jgi:hypothetical protein